MQELLIVNMEASLPYGKLTNEFPWEEFGDIVLLKRLVVDPLEIKEGFSETINRLKAYIIFWNTSEKLSDISYCSKIVLIYIIFIGVNQRYYLSLT